MSKLSHSEAGKLGYLKAKDTLQQKHQQKIIEYNKNPKLCKCCNKPIPYEKRQNNFCNQSCAASYNNTIRQRNTSELRICLNCGNPLNPKQHKFCSNKCQNEFQHKEYIEKWKSGKMDGTIGEYGISKHIRRYMLEKANHKCEKCGWSQINPVTGNTPLEIHHIDGDYTNNTEENLEVLCPNCHSLTPNYKSMNKEGRKGREKYS